MDKTVRAWFIRHRHNKKKWSSQAMIKRVGISRTSLFYWCKGMVDIPAEKIEKLNEYLQRGY
jgi:DNA-binding transcriptional regulator YdaS (Cro superfamily)